MKKILALVLMLMLALSSTAFAGDLGIQMIGGEDTTTVPMSLDDLQLGTNYEIDGYSWVIPEDFQFVDYFGQFKKDANYKASQDSHNDGNHVYYQKPVDYWTWYYTDASWQSSGANGEFAWLLMDVTNLQKKPVAFMEETSIKVVYDDEYEFVGWMRQINYDYNKAVYRYGASTVGGPVAVLHPDNEEAIDMMYTGTYVFGCTLPNSVVEDKSAPLRMEIKLGENDLTYHIRK